MNLHETYTQRIRRFSAQCNKLKKLNTLMAFSRLACFIAMVIIFIVALQHSWWFFIVFVACTSLFAWLIKYNEKIKSRINLYNNLIELNKIEQQCLKHNYKKRSGGLQYLTDEHDFAHDLDVFGEHSLFQYINRTATEQGEEMFAAQLLANAPNISSILKKQQANYELVHDIGKRQRFWALASVNKVTHAHQTELLTFLNSGAGNASGPWFGVIRLLVPIAFFSYIFFLLLGLVSVYLMGVLLVMNLLLVSVYGKTVNHTHLSLSSKGNVLLTMQSLLKIIAGLKTDSDNNRKHQQLIIHKKHNTLHAIKQFHRLVHLFDFRLNLFMGGLLNATLAWDLNCLHKLNMWKENNKLFLPGAFKSIAYFDCAFTCSNFIYNHPQFQRPVPGLTSVLQAASMGHPLIPGHLNVRNDFNIDNKGQFVIITGANMAGKSTFLRAVGVNMLLAGMGLPVCASAFNFMPHPVFSSMRTADSLGKNESYFYAELKRLKLLLQKIKEGTQPFILLDEILKGTNSKDKQEGSVKFLEQLIKLQSTGIIATHDLSLANTEKKHPEVIKNKCFEIEVKGDNIVFDYKLYHGVTQKMNAMLLMNNMGIINNA